MNTAQKYARCLATTGHRYGDQMVRRDLMGHMYELKVCRRCHVPETPKYHSSLARRPRDVITSYWDE